MTPGEAAVMKASVGWASFNASLRFSASFCTAVRSFQSMGPLHDGRDTSERRSARAAASGKYAQSALSAEPGEAMSHVSVLADLALLAVADDVDARVDLHPHDLGDGPAHARLEGDGLGRRTGVQRFEHH